MEVLQSKKVKWIDIKDPKKEDIDFLDQNFKFRQIVLEELLSPTISPKAEFHDDYIYLVLHFPIYNIQHKKAYSKEIDFLITKDTLITVRYDDIKPFKDFHHTCSISPMHHEKCLGYSVPHLLHYITEAMYDFTRRQLDHIQEKIDRIDSQMFKNKEREMVEQISIIKRDIIDLAKSIKPHEFTLQSLSIKGVKLFGKKSKPFFIDILGSYSKINDLLENHKETAEALYATNESLLTTKTNEIMKLLTLFAVVVFPLTLISSIFGMNVNLPLVGHKFDFWILIGIMAILTLGMLLYFKSKRWF